MLPVSGRNAVLCVQFSSGTDDVGTLQSIARDRKVTTLVEIDGHHITTGVPHVHLVQEHVGK